MAKTKPFIDLDFEGFEEVNANFKSFDEAVQKRIMNAALKDGAAIVLFETQQEVPVDEARLLRSLDVKPFKRNKKKTDIGFFIQTGTREELGIDPKDKNYYPAVIEFGSKKRNMQPDPYMRRGLDKSRSKAFKAIRDKLEKRVKSTVKRLAKKAKK